MAEMDMGFVDQLIADEGNAPDASAPAENSAPNSSDTPAPGAAPRKPAAAPAPAAAEGDDDAEQAEIDAASPEKRKEWDKKFVNALSRRDKALTKERAEKAALLSRLEALERGQQPPAPGQQPAKPNSAAAPGAANKDLSKAQGNLDAQMRERPKVDDAKYTNDYGQYLEDLAEWKGEVKAAEMIRNHIAQQQQEKDAQASAAAGTATEQRIIQQAQKAIQANPEIMNAMQANADILDSYQPQTLDVIAQFIDPVTALFEISKIEGGLEKFGTLPPAQAAAVLGMAYAQAMQGTQGGNAAGEGDDAGAEAQHEDTDTEQQPPQKPVSNAPKPLTAARTAAGGKKQLHQMDADEIFVTLGL